ncbi:hypothetical protein COT75_05010 [Candidatus Beckwithbacteria bacterium CG10_big_fil_rev_8_21_14_0_10_34_10]|uniref:Uncharacterized protein n=1 Tax=Candidatus Beckwithbacteria bacterium CG10_big_fil_rev_8_21_14_0_10_34_10 TaxID=1974495 RepID=A0A2H0W819_9BACT|nr:MAG: hypothetical protein COT75_05010 [Candidatus Beckwithbacteria bacterium CG10_big_fil_rev_8_21_14_0_10_34_10]
MEKVEVLLINPFLTVQADDPSGISPPLSLAYLAAYLRKRKVKVAILDISAKGVNQIKKIGNKVRIGLNDKQIVKKIKKYNPRVVGITCTSTLHASEALKTASLVKKANPKILVAMGGIHPTVEPEKVLKNSQVDLTVRGEGEITFWQIIKKFKNAKVPQNILGTSYKQGKNIINNPLRPFIKNLNSLPFPTRDLLPMDIYFKESLKHKNYTIGKRVMSVITSRGCPGNCSYCSIKTIWGRVWRARSAENVVDEIASLIKNYKCDEIHFMDDSISVNKKRLLEICNEIIKRRLKIKWTTPNGIAIWLLDKRLLVKMKKAGCYRLTFGLESGNKDVLNNYIGKYYNYNKAKEMISFASEIGLWTAATFIIGFPYETKKQIEETINFAISTDLNMAVFYIANPFPGTKMYEDFLKENLLPRNKVIIRGCKTKHFSHQELTNIQAKAFNQFMKSRFKRPLLYLNKVKSLGDLLYIFKLGKNLMEIFINQNLSNKIKKSGIAALWK